MTDKRTGRRISVFDTTLRDGEQAPGNSMLPEQKLDLALRMEEIGVDCVEAAFPASSPKDFAAARLISRSLTRARFATFSRTSRKDVSTAVAAGGIDNHEVQMVATASDLHLKHKRGISRAQAVAEVADTVAFAKSLGIKHISVGLEDASRGADELLRALTEAAVEHGATCVIVADTTGCATPAEFAALVGKVRQWAPPPIRLSTHCHNDFGLSLANAVAGVQAGADEVQVTLGGIGERSGNTPLEELAALLAYKHAELGCHTDIDLGRMYGVYTALRQVIALEEPRNKPIFGTYAFSTAAGIHQQGMLNEPSTYEYVEPARFGRERAILVGRHSGRSVLRHILDRIGIEVDEAQLDELYRVHIAERVGGDCEDISVVAARLATTLVDSQTPVGASAGRNGA
jgi:2-isopropylmalate synthase